MNSFLSQFAAFFLEKAVPAIEKSAPAVRYIGAAVIQYEAGQPVTVKLPWIGDVVLIKPSALSPAPAPAPVPAPVVEPTASV